MQETVSLPPPASGDAIQEQNLKAALDSPNIFVETTDNDGNASTVEIEREVRNFPPSTVAEPDQGKVKPFATQLGLTSVAHKVCMSEASVMGDFTCAGGSSVALCAEGGLAAGQWGQQ